MAITYVNSVKAEDRTDADTVGLVITHGLTLANDDVLYALIGVSDDAGTAVSSTGWVQIHYQENSVGNDGAIAVLRKVITDAGSEPSSYAFLNTGNTGGNENFVGAIVQMRGVDTTTPEDGVTPTFTFNSNTQDPNNADIDTASDNDAVLVGIMASQSSSASAWTACAPPSGYTIAKFSDSVAPFSSGFRVQMGIAYAADVGAAATQTIGAWNTDGETTQEVHTVAVALRAAAVATTPRPKQSRRVTRHVPIGRGNFA